MASLTDYAEKKLLDHLLGTASFTQPTVYVALFTAAPDDTGGGTEVSGGSYARQGGLSFDAATGSGAGSSTADNSNAITFPQATAGWGTVTHFALFDAASGGNMLAWGALSSNKTVQSGDTPEFSAGSLTVKLD